MTQNETPTESPLPALYQHAKRKSWGVGLLAWEHDDKRAYLFEDGQLRVLAKGFYGLLREVDRPRVEVESLLARLGRDLRSIGGQAAGAAHERSSDSEPTHRFEDQLAVFEHEFPGGFDDPDWASNVRGTDAKKPLKRHRDPSISAAAEKLNAEHLAEQIAKLQYGAVWRDVLELLAGTDLVPAAQVKELETEDAEALRALAVSVRDVLHGDGSFDDHLGVFCRALERCFGNARWQATTALCGLVLPDSHVVVRPSSFREQARSMAPRMPTASGATAGAYARYLAMSRLVREKLVEAGHKPRDLMDVHDFVRLTTRPAAKQLAFTLRAQQEGRASEPPPEEQASESEAA